MINWIKDSWNIIPLWVGIALIIYAIYCVFRTWNIFSTTMDTGLFRGLFDVYLKEEPKYEEIEGGGRRQTGYGPATLRLYHIIWFIIDIPCICIGACLPFVRRVFSFKIIKINRPKKEEIH